MFLARLGGLPLLLVLLAGFARQEGPSPDPGEFLAAAKPRLSGNFLQSPNLAPREDYTWEAESSQNNLDKQRNLRSTDVVARHRAYWDGFHVRVETKVSIDGSTQKTFHRPVGGVWPLMYASDGDEVKERIWEITTFSLLGRVRLNGRRSLVFSFRTECRFKVPPPKSETPALYRSALCSEGKAWFDEEDLRLVRVDGRYYRGVAYTKGLVTVAGVSKGETWSWQLRRIAGGVWVPDYTRVEYAVKRGWFKKGYRQVLTRWSHFQRIPDQ